MSEARPWWLAQCGLIFGNFLCYALSVLGKIRLPKLQFSKLNVIVLLAVCLLSVVIYTYNQNLILAQKIKQLNELEKQLSLSKTELADLKNQDQYKINQDLKKEIDNIIKTYKRSLEAYESITDLDVQKGKTEPLRKGFAQILANLAERNYASAEGVLRTLSESIQKEKDRIAVSVFNSSGGIVSTANLPISNAPPGAGYSRQVVSALGGQYVIDIVAADMNSTRIIVDTASDGDCRDSCPVLSLGDYVARNGAFAGINGSYFCPADYPSCAGKSNSFDTLAMNRNKKYINSDNNVYSTVPAVIFQSGSMRFVGQSLEWGRDTGVDGVLANQPLLLSGGNVTFNGSADPKQGSKGSRSFVGNKGGTAYIGVARNVTVAEMAHVLKALGLENALNLDSGGSTALWSGGYKAGPGRGIPNAILFVRK